MNQNELILFTFEPILLFCQRIPTTFNDFLNDLTERGRGREEAWPGFHNRAICCPRVCAERDFAVVATSGLQIIQA